MRLVAIVANSGNAAAGQPNHRADLADSPDPRQVAQDLANLYRRDVLVCVVQGAGLGRIVHLVSLIAPEPLPLATGE